MLPPFSPWILLGLVVVLGASCLMFWTHVRRWTQNRAWVALGDWAGENRFKLHRPGRAGVPAPLEVLTQPAPRAVILMSDRTTSIVQMETPVFGAMREVRRWNVLVRRIDVDWPTTALRPSNQERSLVDLFSLASFPALLSSERFTVHGDQSAAARAVVGSMLMALLPQDLGLVLHGRALILDFSTRPFDGIELSRMRGLVEQLVGRLPMRTRSEK
ncbi:MAG TPA: hypothetical protein VH475_02570 [Tepidisphaeraceae bacterium]|jgi:hypothetical protein